MHTAVQLTRDLFTINVDHQAASYDELLPDWSPLDRVGIVIHEAFGAVGASYLLQAATAAYYDAREGRRDRSSLIYPDFYLFHVGGRHGDHMYFDVFPPRKQVFVDNHPIAILHAINDRGISRLVVPERSVDRVQLPYKEPAQALDRITSAWVYSPTGRVADGDVAISATSPRAEANTKLVLYAEQSYEERQQAIADNGPAVRPDDELLRLPPPRDHEVPLDVRNRIWEARSLLLDDAGRRTETYRRIDVRDALRMLHRGPAPPWEESDSFGG